MRIALGIEYVGSGFSGWQVQQGERTVQGALEEALSRVAARSIRVTCAGRTDAGVHALGQVVHFDTDARRPVTAWTLGANSSLPADASVRWALEASDEFHARFSALSRTYRYVIYNAGVRSPLLAGRTWWRRRPLDVDIMQVAVRHLLGEHDFSSFRAAGCQARSPVRRVTEASVTRRGALVCVQITANAFLHHMVRNVAGTLAKVGTGEADPDWVGEVLDRKDRRRAGMTAPPDGLYFVSVDYGPLLPIPEPLHEGIPGGTA